MEKNKPNIEFPCGNCGRRNHRYRLRTNEYVCIRCGEISSGPELRRSFGGNNGQ